MLIKRFSSYVGLIAAKEIQPRTKYGTGFGLWKAPDLFSVSVRSQFNGVPLGAAPGVRQLFGPNHPNPQ